MSFVRRVAVLVAVTGLVFMPDAARAQPTLTNAGTWRACSDGHAGYGTCGFEFWDSNVGGWSDNFWSTTPSGVLARLNTTPIQLAVGTNTLYFYQNYYSFNDYLGLDLLFDGSSTSQIGGWNTDSTSGVNPFNGVNTLFNGVGGPLSFTTGGYQVTLTSFQYVAPLEDRVGASTVGADEQSDWMGAVTLEVQSATPEPASILLFATGLACVAVVRRRRAA